MGDLKVKIPNNSIIPIGESSTVTTAQSDSTPNLVIKNNPDKIGDDADINNSNVYTVKLGDTLSKIAKEYNIKLEELLKANPEITNPSLIFEGQKIKIPQVSQPIQQKQENIDGQNPNLIKHMTLEQAKEMDKVVPGTLELFKSYAAGSKILSDKAYINFQRSIHNSNKLDRDSFSKLNSTLQLQVLKERCDGYVDKELLDENNKDLDIKQIIDLLNSRLPDNEKLDISKLKNATPEEKGRMLADAEKKVLKQDISPNSKVYKEQYERLKRGEFTEHERKQLSLVGDVKLTDEQLKEYAAMAVMRKHITVVASTTYKAGDVRNDDDIMALLHGFNHGLAENKDDPDVQFILAAIGVKSLSTEKQQEGAKIFAEMSTNSQAVLDDDTKFIIAETVLQHASADVVEEFMNNNPGLIESIKEVIDLMPEGSLKTNLQNIVERIVSQQSESDYKPEVQPGPTRSAYHTNAINEIRVANQKFNEENGIPNYSQEELVIHQSAFRIGTELSINPPVKRYTPERISNLVQDFNNTFANFDDLTKEEQDKVLRYLNDANAPNLVSILVSANSEAQKFLMNYVKIGVIFNVIKPDQIMSLIDPIKENLAEYTKQRVDTGVLKENLMTQAEQQMYKLSERYSV